MKIRSTGLLVTFAIVLVACGAEKPTLTPASSSFSPYEELLGLVPDTREARSGVFIINYALVRQLFDIPLPKPDADQGAMEEYYNYVLPSDWTMDSPDLAAMKAPAPYLSDGYAEWSIQNSLGRYLDVRRRQRQYLGFDIRNEDQAMVAGRLSSGRFEVLRGRFNPRAFDSGLGKCSGDCTPPEAREEYQGITFYRWGEDYKGNPLKVFGLPAFDQTGRGGRISVQDRYVFRTLGTMEMKSMIDASRDKRPSLADRQEFQLLARGMSDLGAYAVFLTDRTRTLSAVCLGLRLGEQDCQRIRASFERQSMLRPYQVFGTGAGKDEIGSFTALVLVHADESAASDNALLLRRRIGEPWSRADGTRVEGYFDTNTMEVLAKGRLVLAKLHPTEGRPPIWIDWETAFAPDPLLMNEP